MALISTPVAPQQATVADHVENIKKANLMLKNQIQHLHTRIFNMVWKNKDFTAKQIVDEFGTDAVAMFTVSGTIQGLLASIDPSYEALVPPKTYTPNQDGTVTVAE